jgi:hypothetical protein
MIPRADRALGRCHEESGWICGLGLVLLGFDI